MARPVLYLLAVAAFAACGSATSQARRASDTLTRDEMVATAAANAYDAVAQLRPHFLHTRGTRSFTNRDALLPIVYVEGVRQGRIEVLRSMRVEEIAEIRYFDAGDATIRHGTGHLGGVIEVRMYTPPR